MIQAVAAARTILECAVDARTFPAAVAEVGNSRSVLWRESFGTLTFDSDAHATDETIFDLASLTKPVATTTVIMQQLTDDRLALEEPVASFFAEWRGTDREAVTIRELLEHSSGLAARLIDPPPAGRREFEHEICTMRLEYPPRSRSLYSDLGFILLGFLAGDRGRRSLPAQLDEILHRADAGISLTFGSPADAASRTAPTYPLDVDARRGRRLTGEVHDNYAAALGGIAGHAGVFGTARSVGSFARVMLRGARGDVQSPVPFTPSLVERATTKSAVPDSSRALGWDRMLPTSSCGTRMSPAAFGHVGYTGTSLWIDPVADRYFVLLTNRACQGGTLEEMRNVRRAFHEALATL